MLPLNASRYSPSGVRRTTRAVLGASKRGSSSTSDLLALGCVADLVVANHRRPRPSRDEVGANVPHQYIASLSCGNQCPYNEPSVLRLIATVEQQDRTAVGSDGDAGRWILRRQNEAMTRGQRQRFHSSIRCLLHWSVGVTREDSRNVVCRVRLAKIERRQELKIESSLPSKCSRNGLVQLHCDAKSPCLGLNIDAVAQPAIRIRAERRNLIRSRAALSLLEIRNRVPLLGRCREAHVSTCGNALIVEDDFHPVHLLVAEHAVIFVVKQQHAQAVSLKHVVLR